MIGTAKEPCIRVLLDCLVQVLLFKSITTKPIQQYVKAYQIKEANTLLRTTNLSIKEIGNRCGIEVLDRAFRNRKVGKTPRQYRAKSRKSLPDIDDSDIC
jgi:transcriptional regulator GlxA family with amidase domain